MKPMPVTTPAATAAGCLSAESAFGNQSEGGRAYRDKGVCLDARVLVMPLPLNADNQSEHQGKKNASYEFEVGHS